ncbi:8695_t:CDS:2 [Cetraspora pellucida]|uniref:8695_t:CDS:1 n=1 Tax=Cetraspora pellucida TaxID=1433469 RepID=A0A9N9IIJ4_9GLOM|nr:8695_t:CDS:2 [Cetraspora pellucida]
MVDFLIKAGMVILIIEATPKSEEDSVLLTKIVKICSFVIKAEEISDIANTNILNHKMAKHLENKPKKTLKEMHALNQYHIAECYRIPLKSLTEEFIIDYSKYDEMKWFRNLWKLHDTDIDNKTTVKAITHEDYRNDKCTTVTKTKKHQTCLELIKTCTPIRDIDDRSRYKADDVKRYLNTFESIQYFQNLVPKMAWVFDNTDASSSAKKSGLKSDRAKLGLLNLELYATYGSKLKATNNKHTHYHLVDMFNKKKCTKVLNKYNLSAKSNLLQLCAYADELSTMLPNWKKTEIGSEQIYIYEKLPEVTQEELRRIQNINTTKIPNMQDFADYKPSYSWYCIRYIKNKGKAKNNPESWQFLSMEKNSEHAKELLIWIQDAIATEKLCNPIYTKRLRKIKSKYASRIYDGQNLTLQHLKFVSRVAMRHKIDHHNSGIYYAEILIFKAINENTSKIEDIDDLYRSI